MSLYGMMRTGVSGMNAQANRLSTVADNIANASTVGYKRAETQFSSLVLPSTAGQYNSGSVLTDVRYGISDQGGIRSTSSTTDLAIDGNGYFVVQGPGGSTYLTRAGSFVPDKNGDLVNSAGYYLLGAGADEWNVSVKNAADGVEIGTTVLNFDPTTGDLVSGGNVAVNLGAYGGQTLNLNLGGSTQRAGDYTISQAVINGQAPSSIKGVDVGNDGAVVAVYENGTQKVLYRIPLANVASPDRMTVVSGNIFLPSAESGDVRLGFPQGDGMGKIMSGTLEESNADIAQELTDMIEAQRSYTANSKVFQTGFELMDVLVNLKR